MTEANKTAPPLDFGSTGLGAWVPVELRMPEFPEGKDSVECICSTDSGNVTAMNWTRNRYAKTARGQAPKWEWKWRTCPWRVTHWMPLPQAPNDGGNPQ